MMVSGPVREPGVYERMIIEDEIRAERRDSKEMEDKVLGNIQRILSKRM